MINFWEFQQNSSIFEQDVKHKEEDHEPQCIFDLKELLNEIFLTNGFRALKATIKPCILAEYGKNPSSRFQENSKYLIIDYFSLILRLRLFWNIRLSHF